MFKKKESARLFNSSLHVYFYFYEKTYLKSVDCSNRKNKIILKNFSFSVKI